MKDLFINLAGLHSENLTTEILKIILTEPGYEIYSQTFFSYLLEGTNFNFEGNNKYSIDSQLRTEKGIPDLVIVGDESMFIVENKFFANFSGDDQVIRYLDILKDNPSKKNKKLFILTIKRQHRLYDELIDLQLQKCNRLAEKLNIDFKFWDDILLLFQSNNFLIEALTVEGHHIPQVGPKGFPTPKLYLAF